ncbi:hypothetical protein EVAR_83886_1 [Eumeta japonica]|uniref:ZAD domain-containing protein n=1 Tax=Eumeta variegata TaxID=151549 RepID=A0A4C1USM3_EUMVA|nr:hypothetical protein EVAR_83886_1 [Eumeta japonica]
MDSDDYIDIKSCRICLSTKKPLCPLFKYKLSGNYAEMLTAIADVKVSCNDGLPDKICGKCCTSLEKAFLLKTIAERSDRKMRKKLQRAQENKLKPTKKIAFNSITDIKSEIGPLAVKVEPKWESEIEVLVNENGVNPAENVKGKNMVIANTIIRKVDQPTDSNTKENFFNEPNDQWKSDAEDQVLDDDDDVKDGVDYQNKFSVQNLRAAAMSSLHPVDGMIAGTEEIQHPRTAVYRDSLPATLPLSPIWQLGNAAIGARPDGVTLDRQLC